jgi:hypothetical protein
MELSPELVDKATKFFSLHQKVEVLHSSGRLAGDKYEKFIGSLTERAHELRRGHMDYIDKKVLELTSGIINIETMTSNVVSQSLYQSRFLEMSTRRDGLQTEKAWLAAADDEEYLSTLKNELTNRVEKAQKTGGQK